MYLMIGIMRRKAVNAENLAPRLTYTRIIVLGLLAIILLGTLLLSSRYPHARVSGRRLLIRFYGDDISLVTGLIVYDIHALVAVWAACDFVSYPNRRPWVHDHNYDDIYFL